MEPVADDLERQSVADALVASHVELLEVEARQLMLAALWADLHPVESLGSGVVLGRSHVAAATLMADALDVRHRLPQTLGGAARRFGAGLAGPARHRPDPRPG
jgi:hypothetical protein